jgi:hypothetical protein
MRLISFLLVLSVAFIVGQVDVDPGPSVKIKKRNGPGGKKSGKKTV